MTPKDLITKMQVMTPEERLAFRCDRVADAVMTISSYADFCETAGIPNEEMLEVVRRERILRSVLEKTAGDNSLKTTRDRAMFACQFVLGIRSGQIASLRVGDFDGWMLNVPKEERSSVCGEVFPPSDVLATLEEWLSAMALDDEDPLFPALSNNKKDGGISRRSIYRAVKSLVASAGYEVGEDFSITSFGRKEDPCDCTAWVYFIQQGKDGPIKIGWSVDPKARLLHIKSTLGCEEDELLLLGKIPGTRVDESKMHQRFDTCHLSGEWFAPAHRLLGYILDNGSPDPPAEKNLRRQLGVSKPKECYAVSAVPKHRQSSQWQQLSFFPAA